MTHWRAWNGSCLGFWGRDEGFFFFFFENRGNFKVLGLESELGGVEKRQEGNPLRVGGDGSQGAG